MQESDLRPGVVIRYLPSFPISGLAGQTRVVREVKIEAAGTKLVSFTNGKHVMLKTALAHAELVGEGMPLPSSDPAGDGWDDFDWSR